MSDQDLLVSAISAVFADRAEAWATDDPGPDAFHRLWAALRDGGWTRLGIPEEHGGSGGGLRETATLLRLAGRYTAPLPLAETVIIAGPALGPNLRDLRDGPLTIAEPGADRPVLRDGRLHGELQRVPWARVADQVAVLATEDGEPVLAVAALDGAEVVADTNLAGEPRDTVRLAGAPALARVAAPDEAALLRRGALARALSMLGAMERAGEMSVAYTRDRVQFGRPLARFQAVQDLLARLAGEVAAAESAVVAAVAAAEAGGGDLETHVAKVRVGEAAGVVAEIAHQAHGAIGFTLEYPLQRLTRRLWAWRDEYGGETWHADRVADRVVEVGPDGLWALVTGTAG